MRNTRFSSSKRIAYKIIIDSLGVSPHETLGKYHRVKKTLGYSMENLREIANLPPHYVYIARNSAYKHLLKVGFTTREPQSRMLELSSHTGVPGRFECLKVFKIPAISNLAEKVEKKAHSLLIKSGHHHNKEFFECSLDDCVKAVENAIQLLGAQPLTEEFIRIKEEENRRKQQIKQEKQRELEKNRAEDEINLNICKRDLEALEELYFEAINTRLKKTINQYERPVLYLSSFVVFAYGFYLFNAMSSGGGKVLALTLIVAAILFSMAKRTDQRKKEGAEQYVASSPIYASLRNAIKSKQDLINAIEHRLRKR